MTNRPLWTCPECGEQFTSAHQWHSCGSYDLETHFEKCEPHVRVLFDEFLDLVRECGPVKVIPQKTRIAIQGRMRFAALMPRKTTLRGHLVLAKPSTANCFVKIESYSSRNHVHVFSIRSSDQFTDIFVRHIQDAYNVGQQKHLD